MCTLQSYPLLSLTHMIINRIINQSGDKRYFFNIEKIGFENSSDNNNGADKSLKIIATDGRNVWESFKSKGRDKDVYSDSYRSCSNVE